VTVSNKITLSYNFAVCELVKISTKYLDIHRRMCYNDFIINIQTCVANGNKMFMEDDLHEASVFGAAV